MTQSTKMTPSKTKPSSITNFDATFSMFKGPEFIIGMENFATLQPLHNTQQAYWAIKEEYWKTCKWTATEDDFEKDSVIWNTSHRFSEGNVEKVHAFTKPRIQIIHTSEILVVDEFIKDRRTGKSMNMIIGDLSMPHIAKAFQVDREEADARLEKGKPANRQYSARTKYLINILTKDNCPAHKIPIVLTIKGMASKDLGDMLKEFYKHMNKCYSTGLELKSSMKFDDRTQSTFVFKPNLEVTSFKVLKGKNTISICAIKGYEKPDYSTVEKAKESMFSFSIPKENFEPTWEQMKSEELANYINKHSEGEAKKLDGKYGIAEGVPALMPKVIEALPEGADDTGEDAAL